MFQPDKDTELTFLLGIITMIDSAGSTPLDSDKLNQMCRAGPSKLLSCQVLVLHVLPSGLLSHAHICGHGIL